MSYKCACGNDKWYWQGHITEKGKNGYGDLTCTNCGSSVRIGTATLDEKYSDMNEYPVEKLKELLKQ